MPEILEEPITQELLERVQTLVDQELWGQISVELADLPAADIAQLLAHYEEPNLSTLFKCLPDELKPDVLSYLPSEAATELAEALPAPAAAEIANDMAPDDAADILGELDKEVSAKIIEGMDEESADDVRRLMTYPEDSAGGIMTTELIELNRDQTVLEALDAIAKDPDDEHVFQVYITDQAGVLLGSVTIWKLLRQKDRSQRLGDIMDTEILSVTSDTDQETVAQTMSKYDLSVIPVVDDRGILLGRITHDDAADIIQEEAEEDILKLAGTDDDELGNVSAWRSCLYRLPWLFITLLGGAVTAAIMSSYNTTFKLVIILASFIPTVMGMGGNAGIQSSVLMIREIASGTGRRHSLGSLFLHELRTGALMGLICGTGIFLCALAMMYLTKAGQEALSIAGNGTSISIAAAPFFIAFIAGLSLFCAMTFAAGFGAIIPIILDRIHVDTAVASGPFITVMDDIFAILIYYAVSAAMLMHFLPA